jgi:hypothetical protein
MKTMDNPFFLSVVEVSLWNELSNEERKQRREMAKQIIIKCKRKTMFKV